MSNHAPYRKTKDVFPVYPYYLLLVFDTEDYKIRDLHDVTRRSGPLFAALSKWEFFRQVRIDPEGETVTWPNGLDFDPAVVYAESIPFDVNRIFGEHLGS